ncbi:hypothetical protein GCM10028803_30970 [Larkinella knui]|uniref:Uncharacterized protein n=1 Tax=Larkinella knui TaxID=2025310 RepID=A0A3P1CXP9_9BACT|nr:hypothetical protein [Larkinella knui]RRB18121.1 hypothetical protein EHT87_07560 [Larkinella knui]
MVIVLNGIKNGVNWTNLTLSVKSHEAAFESLSTYVAKGLVLLDACLIDGDNRLELPIEVFDGQPFRWPLQQLQNEWELILGDRSVQVVQQNRQRAKDWDDLLIIYYEKQIDHFSRIIEQLEKAATTNTTKRSSPKKNRLAYQYELLIQRHTQQLAAIQKSHQKALEHLRRLHS